MTAQFLDVEMIRDKMANAFWHIEKFPAKVVQSVCSFMRGYFRQLAVKMPDARAGDRNYSGEEKMNAAALNLLLQYGRKINRAIKSLVELGGIHVHKNKRGSVRFNGNPILQVRGSLHCIV